MVSHGDEEWRMLSTFIDNIVTTETDDMACDTQSLILSEEPRDLLGFECEEFSDADMITAFGDAIIECEKGASTHYHDDAPVSPVSTSTPLKTSSPQDLVENPQTYTSKAFNMVLGIASVVAHPQGSLLGEFCGDSVLESRIRASIGGVQGFVVLRTVTDSSGIESVEVSVKRSVLIKLFQYNGNEAGSPRLSEIFLGKVGSLRSSANIRKIWGSLTRDISRRRSNHGRNRLEFLDKIGYRKISAKNCEFIFRFPVDGSMIV